MADGVEEKDDEMRVYGVEEKDGEMRVYEMEEEGELSRGMKWKKMVR